MPNDSLATRTDVLLASIARLERVAVAYSGGVDSAVVAKAARLALGDDAIAVTAVSPSLASGELENAKQVAEQIGIRHELLHTNEFDQSGYVANAPNRCFFCKTELYAQLAEARERLGFKAILNGANLDDRGDHRPGMQAATDHHVVSPLLDAGFSKADVRNLARKWQLPVWDKPASPCLASRVAYGVQVTPERVARVDAAERFLREEFEILELRVRMESNELARIEVPLTALPRLVEESSRDRIVAKFRDLGFRYVTLDLEGFRSGSLNNVIPVESLTGRVKSEE